MLFYFSEKVGMLDLEQFGGVKMEQNKISQIDLIELEVNRLYKIYQKDYLECEDIMKITGVGKNNIRTEFTLLSFAYNIQKLFNKRVQNRNGILLYEKKIA